MRLRQESLDTTCLLSWDGRLGPFADIVARFDDLKIAWVMQTALGERNDVIHVVLNEAHFLIEPVPLVVDLLDQLLFLSAQLRRLLTQALLPSLQIDRRFVSVPFVDSLWWRTAHPFQVQGCSLQCPEF